MNDTIVSVPGKLYVAGEYGVVAAMSHAVVLPTKLCLTVVVSPSMTQSIESTQWKEPVEFAFTEDGLPESYQGPWAEAVRVVKRCLDDRKVAWKTCRIQITSELDQNNEKKWGLGSSGALTVALVEALLKHHDIIVDKITLFKLCVFAQLDHLEETSFGDVACSVFRTPLFYHMPSREYLRKQGPDTDSQALLDAWPDLVLEPIQAAPLPLIVLNTGVPATTHKLVKHVLTYRNKRWFPKRMKTIEACVSMFVAAWKSQDQEALWKAVKRHHLALTKLGRKTGQILVTPVMKDLTKTFKKNLSTWKFSGAGAGDNVLLFPRTAEDAAFICTHLPQGITDLTDVIEGVKR